MNKEILEERERIKKLVQERIERFENNLKEKRRNKRVLAQSFVIKEMGSLLFLIDNPDYVLIKDR